MSLIHPENKALKTEIVLQPHNKNAINLSSLSL